MFKRENIDVNVIEMTPVVQIKNVIDKDNRTKIIEDIVRIKESSETTPNTSANCWRAPWLVDGDEKSVSKENGNIVLSILQEALNIFQSTLIIPTNFFIDHKRNFFDDSGLSVDAWINVNAKGGSNIYHAHPGGIMSGVLYLQSTGTGEIVFKSDKVVFDQYHPMWNYYGASRYQPEDGDLLLFPSYLGHYVTANPSETERINVAFDIRFKEKQL